MSVLSREQFLRPARRRYKDVPLPDGREVRIQNLTEAEKSDFEASVLTSSGKFSLAKIREQRRRLIVQCLVDDQGERLLSEADLRQLEALDGAVTSTLYDECRKHCGFEEGDLEELVKNSAGTPAGDSLTDSP